VSEGVGEPEGAQQEGALGFVESVVPAASVQQATFVAEPLLDRVDSREQPRVGARQEAHDGEQQDRGVQLVRAERLGVRAGRIAPSSGSPLGARRDRRRHTSTVSSSRRSSTASEMPRSSATQHLSLLCRNGRALPRASRCCARADVLFDVPGLHVLAGAREAERLVLMVKTAADVTRCLRLRGGRGGARPA